MITYRASRRDCDACAPKPKCCQNSPPRKIARSIDEAARDKARAVAKTEAYAVSRRERKREFSRFFTDLRGEGVELRCTWSFRTVSQVGRRSAIKDPRRHRQAGHLGVRRSSAEDTQRRDPERAFERVEGLARRFE
jgi:hypothetical protein